MMENTRKEILIVDDEPDVVAYLSAFLEDNGFATAAAANGGEGLKMARSRRPALILLDVSMPEQSGVRMFRDLQQDPATSDIPVVIVTGVSHDFKRFIETRKRLRPPDGYFDKPPDRDQLLAKIGDILASRGAA